MLLLGKLIFKVIIVKTYHGYLFPQPTMLGLDRQI